MYTIELAERIPADEVTVNSLHPGTYMPTKIVLEEIGRSVDTLESGTTATVRLAVDPELVGVTGKFFDREAGDRRQSSGSTTRRRAPRCGI